MKEKYVTGVDLGGTKIYTAVADSKGRILAETKTPTEAGKGIDFVLNKVVATVRQVSKKAGLSEIPAYLGIGAPGPLDPQRGFVYQAPNLGWRDIPLKALLEEVLQVNVTVGNDANLAALGEYCFGDYGGTSNLIYITVSTGIGCGLILNGELYQGADYSAGEIGHLTLEPDGLICSCGNRGCLETIASGTAIARFAKELAQQGKGTDILKEAGGFMEGITAEAVSRAAASGDQEALGILNKTGRALGLGFSYVVNLLNPSLILLGGGAMKAGPPLWQAMNDELKRRVIRSNINNLKVFPATLGDRSGLLGAIACALQANR
ncbi:MAG TPA: transcriptional regulator [Desulfotomaculum sp.]|nr:MAG: Glucokinase [Desulfotomaculum sp. 46_80]KUK85019.1 MAG: Glucokinase [Desulfofundulus kuznetsovii]HAG10407.1 transcriptional regulator [Desulfotomaculum sp.]HBY03996.1 transcriptional regulator [Desulfotomaculum sp.]